MISVRWVSNGAPKRLGAWALTLVAAGAMGCAGAPLQQARLERISKAIQEVKLRGAEKCAPRHLAIAESQAHFAQIEMNQGFPSRADLHLWGAERHAAAASLLSPGHACEIAQGNEQTAPARLD